ncbi:MAG: PEGA domain-containing protein [Gemmatimonadota bacterium]
MVSSVLRDLSAHPVRAALFFLAGGLLAPILFSACATIMQGTTQEVGISSRPTGAHVTIDKIDSGTTPLVADLKRKKEHTIRIELDGYQPYELSMSKHTSGWVWGNIVFGGIPGLAVDAITGGLYKLRPEQVEAELARTDLGVHETSDALFIDVVLRPEPGWERVGTLTPFPPGDS